MARNKNTTTEAPAEEVTEAEAPATISVKDLCAELKAEPKAFRRWLRTQTTDRAGRGGRWSFSPETADKVKAAYLNRAAAKTTEPTLEASDEG